MCPADELAQVKYRGVSRLRMERIRRGLTLRDVCHEVNISSTSLLEGYELGQFRPGREMQERLAAFYGVERKEVFGER